MPRIEVVYDDDAVRVTGPGPITGLRVVPGANVGLDPTEWTVALAET